MNITNKVEKVVSIFSSRSIEDAKYLLMDEESYFSLKTEVYGSVEAAISLELEEFIGLKVFHNNIGYTFIDVA